LAHRAAELSHVRQQPGERGVAWRQLPSLPTVPRSCRTCDSSRASAAWPGDSSPPCPPCRGAVARATAAGRARRALATAPLLARRAAELSPVRQPTPRAHPSPELTGTWTVCGQTLDHVRAGRFTAAPQLEDGATLGLTGAQLGAE